MSIWTETQTTGWGIAFALLVVGIAWIPIIASLIGAAGSTAGAAIASRGANRAAQTQAQAAQQGIGAVTQAYREGQAKLDPWAQGGLEAYNAMRTLSGFGLPTTAAAAPAQQTMPLSALAGGVLSAGQQLLAARGYPATKPPYGETPSWQDSDAKLEQVANRRASLSQSGYVSMQAPDGSVQPVPPQYVDYYTSRGARVIS